MKMCSCVCRLPRVGESVCLQQLCRWQPFTVSRRFHKNIFISASASRNCSHHRKSVANQATVEKQTTKLLLGCWCMSCFTEDVIINTETEFIHDVKWTPANLVFISVNCYCTIFCTAITTIDF